MLKKFILLQFIISIHILSYAQKSFDKNWIDKISVLQYGDDILKITYNPALYLTNENISDAVIAKPVSKIPRKFTNGSNSIASLNFKNISVKNQNNQQIEIYFNGNNKLTIQNAFQKNEFRGFNFGLNNSEKIYGGGERALPLNRRGFNFNLYNNPWYGYGEGADNLNYSVPFFTSSNGYALFFDNPSKGYVDIGKENKDIFEVGFLSGQLNVYVIFGENYSSILSKYHTLTGTQPVPPRWAFGNLMSRFGYSSQQQANNILDEMRSSNIPVDAIIFDLFWFGDSIKGTMGNLDWVNKKAWPNPAKMIQDFKQKNVQTMLITEPFVVQNTINYQPSQKFLAKDSAGNPYIIKDFYFGPGGLIDIFRKDAQNWFWTKHQPQMKLGVEAWWGDLGEPEKHPMDIYHNLKDKGFKRMFKADEVHNLYGHTWTKMLFDKYAKDYPQKRLFSLNRSGFAGSQRFGIFPWSGDVSRSWTGLRAQLPVMLGMSMSGIPYIHADAGGFAGGEGDNELYVRWLQFAAFTPIFRPHGTALGNIDPAAFSFPSEAALIKEPYQSMAKSAIDLRYALLPYNYTLAYLQAKYGKPLVAPMYFYYPKDTSVSNIMDQYMWGENILVAPILFPHLKERKIYLPEGNWYNLANNKVRSGSISEIVQEERIPIYVKEGSFIPFWIPRTKTITNTSDYSAKEDLFIVYYPSQKLTTGILFDDDGITKNGKSNILHFTGIQEGKKITITLRAEKNNSERFSSQKLRINLPVPITRPLNASINALKLSESDLIKTLLCINEISVDDYNGIDITFVGEEIKIEIELP